VWGWWIWEFEDFGWIGRGVTSSIIACGGNIIGDNWWRGVDIHVNWFDSK